MIIYRPHRGGLRESMAEAREFESVKAMKKYIVQRHTDEELGPAFSIDDIVLDGERCHDVRVGWWKGYLVCTKRYYSEDYMKLYGTAQCIGYCATDYGSLEQSHRMCREFLEGRQ